MDANPYNTGLDRSTANYQPLTPLTFLERAASVFPDHTGIVHGALRRSYGAFYRRSRQLASALSQQTPCAFVELSAGADWDADALRDWCRAHLASYQVPGRFVFMPIPRTTTGKPRNSSCGSRRADWQVDGKPLSRNVRPANCACRI